jgi:AcrR family transcriptional regulator
MALLEQARTERRVRERNATRASILQAARRLAGREGAKTLSLRGVAAEAGFAPAAIYGYFRGKDELMLALAADDLSRVAHAMRDAAHANSGPGRLAAAAGAALTLLAGSETIAAAWDVLPPERADSEIERVFNGRLIAALTALSSALGRPAVSREAQADVVLIAAALTGLAMLKRAGRLAALGFSDEELLARIDHYFSHGS